MSAAPRPELVADLELPTDRAFARIAEIPNIGAPWPRRVGVRRLVLARVGFLVLYRVHARAERIEVLALWHGRRGQPPPGL